MTFQDLETIGFGSVNHWRKAATGRRNYVTKRINRGIACKMTRNKITYNMNLNKQKSTSQVKQQISDELIQENYTNTRK